MVRCAFLLVLLATSGCNLALGIDDHEAIPPNCGVDSLPNATKGFADVRTSHCYSVVKHTSNANYDFAANECIVAGGFLACVTDAEEFALLNQNVTSSAWLGMRFDGDGNPALCDSGESFDRALPIWAGGNTVGGGCSIIAGAVAFPESCGSDQHDQWVCEFDMGADP